MERKSNPFYNVISIVSQTTWAEWKMLVKSADKPYLKDAISAERVYTKKGKG